MSRSFSESKPYNNFFIIISIILIFLVYKSLNGANNRVEKQFEGKTDVGRITNTGSFKFDNNLNLYRITGSGENIWANEDAFYFVWNKLGGDQKFQTDINWKGEGQHLHRKAGIMLRSGLEKDDAYVDAVVHGDGLISMQYRKIKGGLTYEVQSTLPAPATIILERTGNEFTLTLRKDGKTHPVGTISLNLPEEVYSGLVVCSHDSTTTETAIFSKVIMEQSKWVPYEDRVVESSLELFSLETGIRELIYRDKKHFEAPNWSQDGNTIYINSGGKIYKYSLDANELNIVNTGFANGCNNDHGISPDGKELVISHHAEDNKSIIYILPIEGGEPRRITEKGPSYWHGWSPDGSTLTYCAERNGQYDIYAISVKGGEETQLTNTPGLDDGPEYTPDGKFIYFNSVRSGQMKIWRMNTDGTNQIQISPDDEYGDWFAHPSPDGKWIVFVSYDKNVDGHPANRNVVLRKMSTEGSKPEIIATLFGGQGTINVPSWSADSKRFAFVSYRLVSP